MQQDLTAVAPELDVTNNPKPEPVQTELTDFLSQNDCTTAADKDACYVRTRLVLIKMSRRIDYLSSRLYVAKSTITNLTNNITVLITEMQTVKLKQPVK